MKKLLLLFCFVAGLNIVKAQAPQGFSYQAAVRNAVGLPYSNKSIKVQFSILDSTSNGPVVYKETHSTTTNSGGMFNVNVGMGTAITGTLAGVNWGSNAKFLKVDIDTTQTGINYINIGVQKLMSVPYAINSLSSNQILPVKLNDTINKPLGSYVGQFGTYMNNGNLYYWNGYVWVKLRMENCPPPTVSNAGSNLSLVNFEEINLDANAPTIGKGKWKIVSGSGGILGNEYDNKSSFKGNPNTLYNLEWTISNNCESSTSQVNITFNESISFNESGAWKIPKGVDSVRVEIYGGGGGGEDASPCYYGYGCWNKGSGGGGGGYGVFYLNTTSIDSISFIVGKGGNVQTNGENTSCLGFVANGGKSPINGGSGGSSNCIEHVDGQSGGGGSSGRYQLTGGGGGGGGYNNIGNGGEGGLFDLSYGRSHGAYNGGNGRIIFKPIN
jgi:hypothetical protein